MEKKVQEVFTTLSGIDVNNHVEAKQNLKYLSWPWAWSEVKSRYPDATYEVMEDEHGHQWFEDADFGIMCRTAVTIKGERLTMWLPVMDAANKAMKRSAYKYTVYNKYKNAYEEKVVPAATMFDINKTIMRCLTKNIAMFGLGLNIYAGEDMPMITDETQQEEQVQPQQAKQVKPVQKPDMMQEEVLRVYALPAIEQAQTKDDLKRIYNDYKQQLGNVQEFIDALSARKKQVTL
jgi:hypothetical protein